MSLAVLPWLSRKPAPLALPLALAHDRGCEAELAAALTADLSAGQLPSIVELRERFAPDPVGLPEVVVHLTPLIAYEALLGNAVIDEEAA